MDEPIDPRDTNSINIQKFGAIPAREIKTVTSSGPPKAKIRVRYRSAIYPTGGWTINARKRLKPVTKPAWVKLKENFATKSGKSGMTNEL